MQKLGETRYQNTCKVLSDRGSELGITFRWGGRLRQTGSSHRLLLYAYQQDPAQQENLLKKLFQAYFEQERDIGDIPVLAELAEEAGVMSKAEALEFFKTNKLMKEVKALMLDAKRNGVTGVPFTVVNFKYAVRGAQKSDAYTEIFGNLITRGDALQTEMLESIAALNREVPVPACS